MTRAELLEFATMQAISEAIANRAMRKLAHCQSCGRTVNPAVDADCAFCGRFIGERDYVTDDERANGRVGRILAEIESSESVSLQVFERLRDRYVAEVSEVRS